MASLLNLSDYEVFDDPAFLIWSIMKNLVTLFYPYRVRFARTKAILRTVRDDLQIPLDYRFSSAIADANCLPRSM